MGSLGLVSVLCRDQFWRKIQRIEQSSCISRGRRTGNKILFCPEASPIYGIFSAPCRLRAFEDVQVFWRVTFSDKTFSLTNDGVDLSRELVRTSGVAVCRRGDVICTLTLEIQDDEVREELLSTV